MTPAGQLVRPLPHVPEWPHETRYSYVTQVKILRFIGFYRLDHPRPPTIREIVAALNRPCQQTVQSALHCLKAKGIVTWERYQSRTLRIIYDRKET